MPRPKSLQVYVSPELAERVQKAAAANGLAVSEWLRTLVVRGCDNEPSVASEHSLIARLYRQSLFTFVGIDALLSGHPDNTLRERVHRAFLARCEQACVAATPEEGGSHEA